MNTNLTPRINRHEQNLAIDGAMEIWPEGTSRSVANNTSLYGSVLVKCSNFSTGVTITNDRQTGPSNVNLQYRNRMSKTAAGTLAAGSSAQFLYHVEGYDLENIMLNTFSIAFIVRSSVASNRSVSIRNSAASHSYVRQYNIASANTDELVVLSFPALSTCPGTVLRDSSLGIQIRIPVISGTTFQTASLNQWVSGDFLSGIGEDTTWLTGTTHDFSISGLMILPGNWEGLTLANYKFIRAGKNFQDEYEMSQRYFEMSNDLGTAPGSNINGNNMTVNIDVGGNSVTGTYRAQIPFKSTKRAVPSATVWTDNGTVGNIRGAVSGSKAASTAFTSTEKVGISWTLTTAEAYFMQWAADARY